MWPWSKVLALASTGASHPRAQLSAPPAPRALDCTEEEEAEEEEHGPET